METRWWKWERRKEDLKAELEAHVRLAVEDRVARGEDPEQARAAALRDLGNLPLVADTTRHQWGWERLEHFSSDLRHAARRLWQSPGYSITVLLTLTLAIGANTAIFSLIYAMMLRSLPVERPDRIVQIKMLGTGPGISGGTPQDAVSGKVYDVLAAHQQTLSGMCAWGNEPLNLHDAGGTRPLETAALTGDCFHTLGLHAALGRLFDESDDKQGGGAEGWPVVLNYNYWRAHFNADPAVLGRVLDFQDKKGVVVGVLQPSFDSVQVGLAPNLYVPSEIAHYDRHNLGSQNRTLLGRLKNGVSQAQAQAELDPIFQAALHDELAKMTSLVFDSEGHRQQISEYHLIVTPGRTGSSYLRQGFSKPLYLIEAMVGLTLLVACAYLATLAATRASARRRELGVRIALGASRTRLAAELCYESILLALAGTTLGILFAWAASRALLKMFVPPEAANMLVLHTEPTGMVLLFALGLTILTVLLAGVAPAWHASRVDPNAAIKEGALRLDGRRPRRIGAWLTPLQVAVSLVIVMVASLMGSTVAHLLAIDPGFSTSGITFTAADFSDRLRLAKKAAKDHPDDAHPPLALYTTLLDRIRHTPGVKSASLTQSYQLSGSMYMRDASSTLPSGEVRKGQMTLNLTIAPGYFATLGIPLRQGRDFTDADHEGAPEVCILSRAAANYFFPGQNALGQKLNLGEDKQPLYATVVGVVGDTLYMGLRGNAPQIVYQPYFGASWWNPYVHFAVRSTSATVGATAVRNAFRQIAPDVPLRDPIAMSQLFESAAGRERLLALLSGFFAVLTLTLSAIGIYGLLNHLVLQRRREIGVRMALGASRLRVVRLVLREAAWMVLPGLLLGAAGAWGTARLLQSLLFGVRPLDPWICSLSVVLLAAAALAAASLPARRAATVDPLVALRHE